MRYLILALILAVMPPMAQAQTIQRYVVVLTADTTIVDGDGNATTEVAGTVVNLIEWDGTSPYTPECTCRLQLAGSLRIGDVVFP